MGSIRWKLLCLLSVAFAFILGCGGGGSSQPPNPTPTLSGLSPNLAVAGSAAVKVTASGTGFVSTSVLQWNGAALATNYVSSTSLTAQIPASDLTSAGTSAITIQSPTPGGGTSGALSFTIETPSNPTPTLTSISPSSTTAGSPATSLTVTGTQFVSTSQVLWNGSALATTYVSSTSLTAQVPASDLSVVGTAAVYVQNPAPGGGTSGTVSFAIETPPNPVPTLTSLTPSSATVGGPATAMTVTGTQFISTSQVLWNGAALATTYVSSTSLTAEIPASDLGSVATATIAVKNPTPGGGQSAGLPFAINPVGTTVQVLGVQGSDLAWNPSQLKLYVAGPTTANAGGIVTVVDPIAGTTLNSLYLTSAPTAVAISDDNQYLYAIVDGGSTIQRLILPALTPDIQWPLGSDLFGNNYLAGGIAVQPEHPHTVAVTFGSNPAEGQVAVFDDGVERSGIAGQGADSAGSWIQWKADGSELYSADTSINGTDYSDVELFTMPVTASGVGTLTTYSSAFRAESNRLHYDAKTGYVYSDWGEVVNPANGIPQGNYRYVRQFSYPGPFSAVDSTLRRFYTLLEITEPDSTRAFQVQVFDQTQFQLLSTIVIPNAIGTPTNFIRWGQSGLAFTTIGSASSPGVLYILDGSFVNPSGVLDTSLGTQVNVVPVVNSINPITATVGSPTLTLTVTGNNFIGQPNVYWNGTALPTTQVSPTELTAQIPASDLAAVSQAAITVSNTSNAFPASSSLPFSVNPTPPTGSQISVYSAGGNDLVWDATTSKIYVSMPGVQGSSGDAIGILDPSAGTVTSSGFLGSDPAKLSLSSDSQYLYTAFNGQNKVAQLTLPNFKVNAAWNLGGANTFEGSYYAIDLQAAPGAPQTTAITLGNFDVSPASAGVVIYDGSTPRPDILQVAQFPYSSLQWAGNDSTLYAVDQEVGQDFLVLGAGSSGAVLNKYYFSLLSSYSETIHFDSGTGLVYTDAGQVVRPTDGTVVGNFGASGIAVPDSALNTVFILGQTAAQKGTANYSIQSFDQTTFKLIGSITIPNVVGNPTALITWGSSGLAFTTQVGNYLYSFTGNGPGQLYVISGDFVKPSDASKSLNSAPFSPVQRTWGVRASRPRGNQQQLVVHDNPVAQR